MKVSERTIAALGKVATGDKTKSDECIAPYMSGPELVRFFNEFGGNDVYGQGFPSRWQFAEARLRQHNDTPTLARVIEALFDPRRFLDESRPINKAVEFVNQYLRFDGYELVKVGQLFRVRDGQGVTVDVCMPVTPTLSHPFIDEQIEKCDGKVTAGDFSGAVTNARTLVEAVLLALEAQLTGVETGYDGDLPRLYKRVQKLLNLEPDRKDISDALRAVLSGLSSIVHGLAPLRNKMSDAHPAVFQPSRHHAKLAVNAAKTLVDFLFDTYEYQRVRGLLKPVNTVSMEATH